MLFTDWKSNPMLCFLVHSRSSRNAWVRYDMIKNEPGRNEKNKLNMLLKDKRGIFCDKCDHLWYSHFGYVVSVTKNSLRHFQVSLSVPVWLAHLHVSLSLFPILLSSRISSVAVFLTHLWICDFFWSYPLFVFLLSLLEADWFYSSSRREHSYFWTPVQLWVDINTLVDNRSPGNP